MYFEERKEVKLYAKPREGEESPVLSRVASTNGASTGMVFSENIRQIHNGQS